MVCICSLGLQHLSTARISNIFHLNESCRDFDVITSCALQLLKETNCLKGYAVDIITIPLLQFIAQPDVIQANSLPPFTMINRNYK